MRISAKTEAFVTPGAEERKRNVFVRQNTMAASDYAEWPDMRNRVGSAHIAIAIPPAL
jgi:hypothetical protein